MDQIQAEIIALRLLRELTPLAKRTASNLIYSRATRRLSFALIELNIHRFAFDELLIKN